MGARLPVVSPLTCGIVHASSFRAPGCSRVVTWFTARISKRSPDAGVLVRRESDK